ncbi:hypothetical protein MTO96_038940 [Rhipicephalus appendiculatus]
MPCTSFRDDSTSRLDSLEARVSNLPSGAAFLCKRRGGVRRQPARELFAASAARRPARRAGGSSFEGLSDLDACADCLSVLRETPLDVAGGSDWKKECANAFAIRDAVVSAPTAPPGGRNVMTEKAVLIFKYMTAAEKADR